MIACILILAFLLSGGAVATPRVTAPTATTAPRGGLAERQCCGPLSRRSPSGDVGSIPTPSANIGSAIEGGNISQAIGLGSRYLAVRAPRGTLTRLCAVTCVVLVSTDYGPSSKIRPPRIADVALGVWLRVCDKPASAGICRGSIEYLAPPHEHIELPATDTGD